MTYTPVSSDLREAATRMSVTAKRLELIFSTSYIAPNALKQVKELSLELELANRALRKRARAA